MKHIVEGRFLWSLAKDQLVTDENT
jgi:hypothetical protein